MQVEVDEKQIVKKMDECCVPPHLRGGLKDYLVHHVPTGSFLEAVLSNDLRESFGRADMDSRAGLFKILTFLWNYVPGIVWGSPEKYKAWLKQRKS